VSRTRTVLPNPLRESGRASSAAEVDDELKAERFGDAMERVEIRHHPTGFEPSEGGLRATDASGQLGLCQAPTFACLPNPLADLERLLRPSIPRASRDRNLPSALDPSPALSLTHPSSPPRCALPRGIASSHTQRAQSPRALVAAAC